MNFDCGIYCITGPSGKRYIGQAQSFRARWKLHTYHLEAGTHKNRHLQNAWKKHGALAFTFSKIAIVPIEELDRREQEQINAFAPSELYNIALEVGFSRRGIRASAETRARISAAKKGQNSGAKNHNFGKKFDSERLARMSAAMRGNVPSPETCRKISLANTGKTRSKEFCDRVSERMKGKWVGGKSPNALPIICVETGQVFAAMTEAVQWLRENGKPNADRSCIAKVCKMDGRQKSAYGFTWRYAESLPEAA